MKTLKDIEFLNGVKVLVRADFNVGLKGDVVVDDYRIRMTLPTINYLLEKGAAVILISHLESNDGENLSLAPVAEHMKKLGVEVTFIKNYRTASQIIDEKGKEKGGRCFLLENLRFFEGEKANDPKYAKELASLGDIYVNDAFSVSHRKHASVIGVPALLPSYAGLQLEKEISNLSKAFNPSHPFIFILGGAKFDTKLPLLNRFIETADTVFVGGALANDLLKAKSHEIGISLVSKGEFDFSSISTSPKLVLPVDIIDQDKEVKRIDSLSKEDRIMDAGPETISLLKEKISQSKFILWNGPLGYYEDGFDAATSELAKIVAEATHGGATSIIGGGDTVTAIETLGIADRISFISTGGGAMLDFLAKGTLPGVEVLND